MIRSVRRGAGLGPMGRRGPRARNLGFRGGKPPKSGCLVLAIALIAVPLFLTAFAVGWVVA